jgi:hypothetical protein
MGRQKDDDVGGWDAFEPWGESAFGPAIKVVAKSQFDFESQLQVPDLRVNPLQERQRVKQERRTRPKLPKKDLTKQPNLHTSCSQPTSSSSTHSDIQRAQNDGDQIVPVKNDKEKVNGMEHTHTATFNFVSPILPYRTLPKQYTEKYVREPNAYFDRLTPLL